MKYQLTLLFLALGLLLHAQDEPELLPAPRPEVKIYSTSGGELIFSFADVENSGGSIGTNPRFTGFLHIGEYWHFEFTNNFGMISGFALRNVGMITKDDGILTKEHVGLYDENDEIKIKRRSYSFGVPLAFKFGNFNRRTFVFAGAEAELMFNYKEKLFVNGNKEDKYNEWFSDRTNIINPSIFGGIQFPGGINLKFKYYLLDFLDPDYSETINGNLVQPYRGLTSNIFYISLSVNLRNKFERGDRDERIDDDRT
ncbi:MAG: hypothetical protein H6557_23705 [Lewinellaceae bacterium]|nr:hypothetical protein [Lewinellaceae bacterium]